jgi:hypothetical protein
VLAARLATRNEERERVRREALPGFEEKEQAAAADAVAIEGELRASEERGRALSTSARELLRGVQGEVGDTPEVVRARAALHAALGEDDALQKLARAEQDRGRREPWVDLAQGWMDARDPERARRERSLVRLGALASSRPDLLRGRYLLARAEASLGRRAEALATVDGVLAANARHEGARRLREELTAPPPPPPAEQPSPAPPPAAKASPPARKAVPQSGAAASSAPPRPISPPPAPAPAEASPAVEPAPAPPPAGSAPQVTPEAAPPPPAAPAPAPARPRRAAPVETGPESAAGG